ncbi:MULTISPECIES: DUF418 domain-containing protein [unclassified Novosphingobium]|uniref:DUF418 domain-containing protein n=1 Tax=unclassified Novosphingobium TaxID=2644732 RepID=UPI0025E70FA6|nr:MULTISPECIES: DUF418 domain-containing protein [unclassified Novosphingobium]HQV03075.1 DUF418 domain-containing protein [Novosphingobium sp.]
MTDHRVDAATMTLAPVRGRDRIEVLDALRGFAILAIFYINVPAMAGPLSALLGNIRAMGWSAADQHVWLFMTTFLEGTQRGLLEMLFGAGLMVTAAKAMTPDGPVAVADLYIRRNLWLLLFGLINIFLLLWPGDILHIYALSALVLFPFRKLRVRWLLALGLMISVIQMVGGTVEYISRTELQQTQTVIAEKQAKGQKLSKEETEAAKEWKEKLDRIAGKDPVEVKINKDEAKARAGGFGDYADFWISTYILFVGKGSLIGGVIEAFCTMLIGIALWKLGFIQGRRSTRDYLIALVIAYGFGLTARYTGGLERMTFMPGPKTLWITSELSRLAVTVGHIAAINLLMRVRLGRKALTPLLAAGQMAFTLYLMQQVIGLHILYSPIGFDLPTAPGWAWLAGLATMVIVGQLMFANLWMRYFVSGPLEWVWRSLSYWQRQPFRRRAVES